MWGEGKIKSVAGAVSGPAVAHFREWPLRDAFALTNSLLEPDPVWILLALQFIDDLGHDPRV